MNSKLKLKDKAKLSPDTKTTIPDPTDLTEVIGEVITISDSFVYVKWKEGCVGTYRAHLEDLIKQEEI